MRNTEQEKAALSICVSQVWQHEAFLVRIHDDTVNRGGRLYFDRNLLTASVTRYENLWLPLVVQNPNIVLVPPIDIAWVWHLHRLAPLRYAAYCRERFCDIVDPGKAAFRLQSGSLLDEQDCLETRTVWAR